MIKAFSARITGKVQGVFFRQSSKEKALSLGLTGFVQNEADGSVFLIAEGVDEPLQSLKDWCRHGPPLSRVESIEIVDVDPSGIKGFQIKR